MYFAILPPIKTAFAAFFIGQGKTKIITFSVTIGSILNVILDYVLIYGVKNTIPSMGCRGAAIATNISELVSIAIFAVVFFNKTNRKTFKTLKNFRFNKKLFRGCCKIGIPMSFGNCISYCGGYILTVLLSYISKDTATIYNIGMNFWILFWFVGEGLNKGIATITSNMIGNGDLNSIEKIRKIFVMISILFGAIIAIPLILFPKWLLYFLRMFPDDISKLYSDIKIVLYLSAIAVPLDMIRYSYWGILIAGGDSKYAAFVDQICLWGLAVFPVYVLYCMNAIHSVFLVYILLIGGWITVALFIMCRRYRRLKWCKKLV
jgi:MATE family multidrug resistance protein